MPKQVQPIHRSISGEKMPRTMIHSVVMVGLRSIALTLLYSHFVEGFAGSTGGTKASVSLQKKDRQFRDCESDGVRTFSFEVALSTVRPKPESLVGTIVELWNDPRPISSVIGDRSYVGERENESGIVNAIPYCVISDEFHVEGEAFQVLLYPRGRFVGDSSATAISAGERASVYLRYLPKRYGEEIDVTWRMRLCSASADGDKTALSVATSGGLPRSNTTWSAGMTFCTELESVESVGRAADWGSSSWFAEEVCRAIGSLTAEGEITVFDMRSGESSFSLPPLQRGALGAVRRAANGASSKCAQRDYRVGEVIVPRDIPGFGDDVAALKDRLVYPGIDYRVMAITDDDGEMIFTTESMRGEDKKGRARLALRPCGWKLQQQMREKVGARTDWPVEVEAGLLSKVTATRFNPESAFPRIVSAFQRDWIAYSLALAVALTPIPLTLLARNFVSLYDIPSASMEPTLLRGDVLLVEKFPGAYDRTERGDVVLFQPPPTLRDIVTNSGSRISSTSLFVKRIVGLPEDENIRLAENGDVLINGDGAVGPDRGQCTDEPLRLIDKLLENGSGKEIDRLGDADVYVLGDCKAVSVDSRVFGTLPKENIVGRPVARIWPLNRIRWSGRF